MRLSKNQSKIVAVSVIVLFFAAAFLLAKSEPSRTATLGSSPEAELMSEQSSTSEESGERSTVFLKDFHRSEVRDGNLLWEVKGKNARFFQKDNRVSIEDGNLLFLTEKGDQVRLTSDKANLYMEGARLQRAETLGNVVLVYNDDVTIKTEKAFFDSEKKEVTAPGFVSIENEALTTTGYKLTAHTERQDARLEQDVQTTVHPNSKEKE